MGIQFTPGKNTNHKLNAASAISKQNNCRVLCPKTDANKVLLNSQNENTGFTQKQKIAIAVTTNLGGNTYFGNAYTFSSQTAGAQNRTKTGSQGLVQFLGKTEGQPGGMQMPPKNRF
jgi:hypothetical protein